jgi:hypothetical protein
VSTGGGSTAVLLPRFQTGQVVATPGALRMLEQAGVSAMTLLARHVNGDWGDLCQDDRDANEQAVSHGGRVFSSYEVGVGLNATKVWVITEADRTSSCFLLPEEY